MKYFTAISARKVTQNETENNHSICFSNHDMLIRFFRLRKNLFPGSNTVTDISQAGNTIGDHMEQTVPAQDSSSDSPIETIPEYPKTYTAFPEKLTAKKIGSMECDYLITADGGLYYKDENDLYGIISLDGQHDTGPKYAYVQPLKEYFTVAASMPVDTSRIDALNCCGLANGIGTEIIPQQYASIDILNDRYAKVCQVTEQTTNKNDALIYYTENVFSLSASDDDVFFCGNWYIYDLFTGQKLDGITGTKPYRITGYGDCLEYVTDDNERIAINAKGERIPEDARLFDNGCYRLAEDDHGVIYDSNSTQLFTYSLTGFIPNTSSGNYILATHSSDTTKYVFMDLTGQVISPEFSEFPLLYGELVFCDSQVYDMKGNILIEGTYKNIHMDKLTECAWLLGTEKEEYSLITADGTVLNQVAADDSISVNPYGGFSFTKKTGSDYMQYSLKDQDYTLKGSMLTAWLVQTASDNNLYDIVDSISGQTVISGYHNYKYATVDGFGIYVYAETADGSFDIYMVQ